jgi:hypothetical protein
LTNGFESGASHFIFERSWTSLLADYADALLHDPMLVATVAAPWLTRWAQRAFHAPA